MPKKPKKAKQLQPNPFDMDESFHFEDELSGMMDGIEDTEGMLTTMGGVMQQQMTTALELSRLIVQQQPADKPLSKDEIFAIYAEAVDVIGETVAMN